MTPLHQVIINKDTEINPIWIMRQAGRYLPEFREIRKLNPNFIKLCLNEILSSEITLQPLKRFDLDAAGNIFRYFNVAIWSKSKSRIQKKLWTYAWQD
jgi:uroporphyrinogen-III decarboxylase